VQGLFNVTYPYCLRAFSSRSGVMCAEAEIAHRPTSVPLLRSDQTG
jgi:hypothetical protein